MFGLKTAPLLAGLAAAVALIGFAGWSFHEHARADAATVTVKSYERCEAAVLGKPVPVRAKWKARASAVADRPAEVCPPGIASAAAIAESALACSEALNAAKPPATLGYTVSTSCAAGVQRLYAESETRGRTVARQKALLDRADETTGRAVARAKAEAKSEAERTTRAENERKAAARDSAGERACDAECLRNRSQGWVGPAGG